jgi:prolyl oligopeptidase
VRDKLNAGERLLVDPEKLTLADGKHYSIDYFQPSLDGKYVAYGISLGGSEESILHVMESATGRLLSDTIDRAQFGQPNWLPDDSFFYCRTQKLAADSAPTAKYQKLRSYHHVLGTDPNKEVAVFGYQVSQDVKVTEDDFPVLAFSPGASKYLVGLVIHGVKREMDLYVAPRPTGANARIAWKKVADQSDTITALTCMRTACSWSPTKMRLAIRSCEPASIIPT